MTSAESNIVVHIGVSITEITVTKDGGIVYSQSVRVGREAMDQAIVTHVKRTHGLEIATPTAGQIRASLGGAYALEPRGSMQLTSTVALNSDEIHGALVEPMNALLEAVLLAQSRMPPEVAADVLQNGIVFRGGVPLKDFDLLVHYKTRLPVTTRED
jgi:rod shape-determining protein MreB